MSEHFAAPETLSEMENVLALLRDEDDLPEAIRRLDVLLIECRANAAPEDDRESIALGDYHYYAYDQPQGEWVGPQIRVVPERIVDDRPGCTCWSYGQGGPHDPSCALEA